MINTLAKLWLTGKLFKFVILPVSSIGADKENANISENTIHIILKCSILLDKIMIYVY